MQSSRFTVPTYLSSPQKPASCPSPARSGPEFSDRKLPLASTRSCHTLNIACRFSFKDFSKRKLSKRVQNPVTRSVFNDPEKKEEKKPYVAVKEYRNGGEMGFSSRILPSRLQVLEPSLLGIEPRPPEWPETEDIMRAAIERRANRVEIPMSLRIIKRKQQMGLTRGDGNECCSIKKAFSSMVFILHELQRDALLVIEDLGVQDLDEVLCRVQKEMDSSFVWMFQHVYSGTPSLMLNLMTLLADFTVSSISHENLECQQFGSSSFMSSEEMYLWNSMVEDASRLQFRYTGLGKMIMQPFVSPVTVKLEADNYEEYSRTDLLYKMALVQEPSNSLLLLNYAQFLRLVAKDYNWAEECFKRAIEAELDDAEALSQYADFLWHVRKDLWAAEERYQQAIAAEPTNPYLASKYANFLWSTGGDETCLLQNLHMN